MKLTKINIAMTLAMGIFSTNGIAFSATPSAPTAPAAPSGPFEALPVSAKPTISLEAGTTTVPVVQQVPQVSYMPTEPVQKTPPTAPVAHQVHQTAPMPAGSAPVSHVAPKAPAVSHTSHAAAPASACKGFGPQTPRDIDNKAGHNKRVFSTTPSYKEMQLCNIHFHNNAEHKAKAFSIYAGVGEGHDEHAGKGGGYQCQMSKSLTAAELMPPQTEVCKGIKPGDTIEVHWVHSSCDVTPGKGLGSCSSKNCVNPDLRVETQVFTVVNDATATNFNDLTYQGNIVNGLHQAKSLPTNTGEPIVFTGSTTGPKYTAQACSPVQVTWSVRPACAKVDINSLGQWCKGNVFKEDHAHGVRKLVTNPALLSEIK